MSVMRLRSTPWLALVVLTLFVGFEPVLSGSPMLRLSYLQDSPMAQSSADSWITEDTVANVTALSCEDFDNACEWESISSHNVSLKWFRSSGYLDPAYFGPITNTSTIPSGFYAVAAHDSASDPNISAVLTSASAVCPGGLQDFSFQYWLSPGVVLNLCIMLSVKSYPNFDFCRIMDRSLSPGPVTITTPSLGNNSFQIFLIATNFSYASDKFVGGFAVIDNITFTEDSCVMTPVVDNTTDAPSIHVDGAATTVAVLSSGGVTVAAGVGTGGTVAAAGETGGTVASSGVTGASVGAVTTGATGSVGSVTSAGSGATGSVDSASTAGPTVSSNTIGVTGSPASVSGASSAPVTGSAPPVTAPVGGSALLATSSLDPSSLTTAHPSESATTALSSNASPGLPAWASLMPPISAIATALNSTILPLSDAASLLPIDPTAVTLVDPGKIELPTIPASLLGSVTGIADPGAVVQHDAALNNPMLATGLPMSVENLTALLEPQGGSALASNAPSGVGSEAVTNAQSATVLSESTATTPMDPGRIILSTIPVEQLPFYVASQSQNTVAQHVADVAADPGTVIQHDAVGGNPMLATALPANLSALLEPLGGVALFSNSTNSTLTAVSSPSLSATSAAPGLVLPAISGSSSGASLTTASGSLVLSSIATTLPPTTLDANATAAAAAAKAARLQVCQIFTCDFEPNSQYSCAVPLNYTRWSSTTSTISAVNGTSIAPPTGSGMAYIKGPMPWSRLLIGPGTLNYATNFFYEYKVSLGATTKAVFDVYLKRADFFIETLMASPVMTLPANPDTWNNVTELIFPGDIEYVAFEVRNLAADEVVAVSTTGLQPMFGYDYCATS